jgi:pyruvate dehydrogenase E1 component beta subunit
VPFDDDAVLTSVAKTGKLLIVEEDNLTGGWGAEVAARVADAGFDLLDAPIKRLASYDVPMPFAPVLENFVVPSVERIVEMARAMVKGQV